VVGYLGSAGATPAILDRLVALLNDEDYGVCDLAGQAFRGFGSAAATPAVLDRFADLLHPAFLPPSHRIEDNDLCYSAKQVIEGSPYSPNGPVAEKPHEHRAKKLSAHETRINSMVS
jgi:hypothetical protein